jgi:translation initiation factor 6
MEAAKYRILGSDYVGVFATATDRHLFVCPAINLHGRQMLTEKLGAGCVELRLSGSDLVGLFSKANSNGIILSNLTLDEEVEALRGHRLDMNIGVLESDLNAIGSNILANDRIAIINPDYSQKDAKDIGDVLGVEVVMAQIDGFKTVGANNILTNKGLVINNKATDEEKAEWDKLTGFDSVRSTANTGTLSVGLSAIANSSGIVAGDNTTGYELARIVDALE